MCEQCDGVARGTRRDALRWLGAAAVAGALWPVLGGGTVAAQVDDVEVAPGLRIRPRAAWAGDLRPTGPIGPEDVRFLLVHHTATETDHRADQVPQILRSIYQFHTGPEKGWPDVCYHWFIDRTGTVWEGRAGSLDGPVVADATAGNQGFAQLVCLIGDFTSVMPTVETQESLVRVLAWLGGRYGVDTSPGATVSFVSRGSNLWPAGDEVVASTISGHRDMSATGCPGDTFYPVLVRDVPGRVTALRLAALPPPTTTATVATTTIAPPPPAPIPTTTAAGTTTVPATATPVATTAGPTTTTPTTPIATAPTTTALVIDTDEDGDAGIEMGATAGTLVAVAPGPPPAAGGGGSGSRPWLLGGAAAAVAVGTAALVANRRLVGRTDPPAGTMEGPDDDE